MIVFQTKLTLNTWPVFVLLIGILVGSCKSWQPLSLCDISGESIMICPGHLMLKFAQGYVLVGLVIVNAEWCPNF